MPGWWILLGILIAFLFLVHPNFNRGKMRSWRGTAFAHRGLHDAGKGIMENTLPAFEAACQAGYGIELDVQFSRDMQIVVFHDADLRRMSGDPRRVCELTLAELQSLSLGADGARIPTLRETLDLVNGRAPLLIELKTGSKNRQLCQALMDEMEGYSGRFIVESFNPLILNWFRRHAPRVARGQLVCPMREYIPLADPFSALVMSGLLLNCLSRPDFVAYDANAARFFSPHVQRLLFHTPMAAWTVRTPELAALVEKRHEMSIFER